jgi:hypothetical protein
VLGSPAGDRVARITLQKRRANGPLSSVVSRERGVAVLYANGAP